MRLIVVAVGHKMPAWVAAGFDDYARRMPREARITLTAVRPEPRGGATGAQAVRRLLEAEHRRIAAALPDRCRRVVLDERGRSFSSQELAQRMARWRDAGQDVGFVIGGADGTAPELREDADLVWSLSPLTLPHGLARVILAEQLYRAATILANHPYHRQ
jgi:23S rRNA (pseudouridine1915-N3)-methyltransferase